MNKSNNGELRFGVVGCGNIGRAHMQSIAEIPGAVLAAVADVNEDAAKAASQTYGCTWFGDYRDLVRYDGIDIVSICTPSGIRKDIAVDAARRRKHIVVEKPIEVTVERTDEILRAADENHVSVHGIFGKRFVDVYIWLKGIVDEGRLGRLFFADIAMKWYRPPEYYTDTWRGTWALDGGGALMNQCIHYVDIMQWFMGMPSSVFATTGRFVHTHIETEDTAAALLKFQNGAIGMIQASTAMKPGFSARFSMHGDQGGALMEDNNIVDFHTARPKPEDREALARFAPRSGKAENVSTHVVSSNELHKRQLAAIAQAVRKGVPSAVSGREARKAVAIINAIYRSAAEGREIFL